MKRILALTLVTTCLSLSVYGQNLVQNPSYETYQIWDSLWYLSLSDPSSATAVATQVTADAHEGTTSLELSNTKDKEWTYFFTDEVQAPIHLLANRSYEVRGWMKFVEKAREVDFSIFWNGSSSSQTIYSGEADPSKIPDWTMHMSTITPEADFSDGYIRLGLRAEKKGAGRVLFDDFSVTLVPNGTEADILEFSFPGQAHPAIIDYGSGTVAIQLPYGTDLGALAPNLIELSGGANIYPAAGQLQDFTHPVVYTVTALDGVTTRDWIVTVSWLPNTATDIVSFYLPDLPAPASINTEYHLVLASLPYGSDLSALTPFIEVSPGATINPVSGRVNDFSTPVTYTVTAEDGITVQEWVVAIQTLPNTANDITSFMIPELLSPATIDHSEHTVWGVVPNGTDLSALVPDIEISPGASIDPPSGAATDFTAPVTYRVRAEDVTYVQDWVVSIQAILSNAADITSFTLDEQTDGSFINDVDHTVEIEVVQGTDLTSLSPEISVSPGATIDPASGVSRDFTQSVDYLVTAEDGITTQSWQVNVALEGAVGTGPYPSDRIRVYPNPATENIFMEFAGKADIRLQDPLGRVCYGRNEVWGEFTLNISDLKKGVYILSLYLEDGTLHQRKLIFQ